MVWIPTNYKSKSANKERGDDEAVFKYIKKKKGSKTIAQKINPFKGINKIK